MGGGGVERGRRRVLQAQLTLGCPAGNFRCGWASATSAINIVGRLRDLVWPSGRWPGIGQPLGGSTFLHHCKDEMAEALGAGLPAQGDACHDCSERTADI